MRINKMEVKDLLAYIKKHSNVKDNAHKVFTAYINLMNVPNATVYDVYYNIQGLYEALAKKYTKNTVKNYTQALVDSLNLPIIQEFFTPEQILEFQAQIQPFVENKTNIVEEKEVAQDVAQEVAQDDEVVCCPPNTPVQSPAETPTLNELFEKIKILEHQNKRLFEKTTKQKAKIEELRLDSKNTTTRLWNVLLASINNNNSQVNPKP